MVAQARRERIQAAIDARPPFDALARGLQREDRHAPVPITGGGGGARASANPPSLHPSHRSPPTAPLVRRRRSLPGLGPFSRRSLPLRTAVAARAVHPPPAPPPGGPGRFGGPANNPAKTANRFENVEPRGAAAAFVAAARGQPPPRGASPSAAAAAARASPAAPIVGVSLDMRLGAASPLANGGNNAAAGKRLAADAAEIETPGGGEPRGRREGEAAAAGGGAGAGGRRPLAWVLARRYVARASECE